MRRIFKTRHFSRWMRKTELTDNVLYAAIAEMTLGLVDADLGGGIVKKRVASSGRGKQGGPRCLVATNKGNKWFFIYGFEKNNRANITKNELEALQELAKKLLAMTIHQLDSMMEGELLQEICCDYTK
ncbi:MAG: type II toxin-antitoxin system RelE/ParE family toxin (plasmid) [Candidatus Symbiodolus clandestinus]